MTAVEPQRWVLPVRRVPTHQAVDHSVLWNTTHLSYEQTLFGQTTSLRYNNDGTMLSANASNQTVLLRCPAKLGAVWNEQVSRAFFSTRFRDDGRLVLQCQDKRVVLRAVDTPFMRNFDGHTRSVRDALFLNNQLFASASDDSTIRFWDVAAEAERGVASAHEDYVRTLDNVTENVVMSGGYDRRVHMWDVRVSLDTPVATMAVAHQVERVHYVRQHTMGVVAAADVVTFVDLRQANSRKGHGALAALHSVSLHSKPIASLAYSPKHDTLLTGSFDGRVKFVSLRPGADFAVEATRKFADPVTCVAVHPQSAEFAVGTAAGKIEIHKIADATKKAAPSAANVSRREERVVVDRLSQIRKLLSVYQYHRALRVAFFSRHTDVILTTLEEIQRRCALHVALSGHNDRAIVHVVRFCVQHIDNPDMSRICIATLDTVFAIYGEAASKSPFFHRELLRAHKRIGDALQRLDGMQRAVGMLECVLDTYDE